MANERAILAHLYRRAGFGATAVELDAATRAGWDATLTRLVKGLHEPDTSSLLNPPQFLPFSVEGLTTSAAQRSAEFLSLSNWWIDLMATTDKPLREKLTLLLHEQFPTALSKVFYPSLMYNQNAIFRNLGPGRFDMLTIALSKDPAMLIWLDTGTDLPAHPNENFARELMERFALGVGHYTETDVKQLARAFTGWGIDYQTGQFVFNTAEHDYGVKTFLGHRGPYTGEQAIGIVTKKTDSAHWVTSRFWSWLAFPVGPNHPVVAELAPVYGEHLRVSTLIEAILHHPQFTTSQSMNGLVKQPVEYVVGTMRALGLRTSSFSSGYITGLLTKLGQELFDPPTVGGWGDNGYWLSTAASLTQLDFAETAANLGDLSAIADEPVRARTDALANMLGVHFSKATETVLHGASGNPQSLVTLGLVSPEYLMN